MPPAIVGNHPIAALRKKQHLRVPGIGSEGHPCEKVTGCPTPCPCSSNLRPILARNKSHRLPPHVLNHIDGKRPVLL